MSYQISYDPVSMRWSLSDGSHYLELPEWAREVLTWVHERETKQLKAENAKLRELCADMYRCSDPCNDCPHYNCSNSGFYCDLGIGWKARRMRELGMVV